MARRTTTRPRQLPPDTPTTSTIRAGLGVIMVLAAFALVAAVLALVFRSGTEREQRSLTEGTDRAEVAAIGDIGTNGQGYEIVIPLDLDGDGTGYKLFAIRPDGDSIRKLLPGPAEGDSSNETYPAWSPDGSTLAYSSNRDGNADIYLWDGSGEPYPITDSPEDERNELSPQWAPDGRTIAFFTISARSIGRSGGTQSLNLSTGELRSPTSIGGELTHWSPDGSKVAGLALGPIDDPPRRYTSTMWLANGNGSDEMQISNFPANSQPDWSPDGSQFVFTGDNMVYLVSRDGTNLHAITDPSLAARDARWSPDGGRIAFAGVNPETGFAALYIVAPDGSGLQRLTEQRNEINRIAWSPDGDQIAYVTGSPMDGGTPTGGSSIPTLHVVAVDGSDDREIAGNVAWGAEPIWRPVSGEDMATAAAPPTATLPTAGQEIGLPEPVRTIESGGATIQLVTAGNLPPITVQQAMAIVAAEFPWGNGGQWDGKPISIRAWYGIGTLTDVAPEPITDRPVWVLDYGNVQGIIPSQSPDDPNPLTIPNHNVYAIDVETKQLWFAGSYLEEELETGPTPSPPANSPSPTAGPPMDIPLAPIIARVESSGITVSLAYSNEIPRISREAALDRLRNLFPYLNDHPNASITSGLAWIAAADWAVLNREMHIIDIEITDDDDCPRAVDEDTVTCHDIYAVDSVTGEVLSLGRSREPGPPSGD